MNTVGTRTTTTTTKVRRTPDERRDAAIREAETALNTLNRTAINAYQKLANAGVNPVIQKRFKNLLDQISTEMTEFQSAKVTTGT